jgi:hypothetical protein
MPCWVTLFVLVLDSELLKRLSSHSFLSPSFRKSIAMADFSIPEFEDSVINLRNANNELVGTIEAVDVVSLYQEAYEQADKLSKDRWELLIDLIYDKTKVQIGSKGAALSLFNLANEMLADLKKKSSLLQRQLDSMESDQ